MVAQLHYGSIQGVYPPGDPQNINGYQYEYAVLITGANYCQIPLHHVLKSDAFGAADEFEDSVLEKNQMVLVACLRDYSTGVIVGGLRNSKTIMDVALGHHWTKRYNKVTMTIDKDSNWSVTSDSGPTAEVNTDTIVLDDSAGDSITLDRVNKIITIEANAWKVDVQGDANIMVGGDANITATGDANVQGANVNVQAEEQANVEAPIVNVTGDAEVSVSAPVVSVQADVSASVEAPVIEVTADADLSITAANVTMTAAAVEVTAAAVAVTAAAVAITAPLVEITGNLSVAGIILQGGTPVP